MNIQSADDARLFLQRRRALLQGEIANLRGRLEEIEFFLLELEVPPPPRPPPVQATPKTTRPANGSDLTGIDLTRRALRKAGAKGMAARDLANMMNVPVGTASSRLSQLKRLGEATHVKPTYYTTTTPSQGNNPGEP